MRTIVNQLAALVTTSLIAIAKFVTRFSVINRPEERATSTESPYDGFVKSDWEHIGADMKKAIIYFDWPK